MLSSTIKTEYHSILLEKLPTAVKKEVEAIRSDTDNFKDPELVEIFAELLHDLL